MPATYFILASYGSLGSAWVERDVNETDRAATIRDIYAAQVDKPLKVIEVDAEEGTARDVTEDIAREVGALAWQEGKRLSWDIFQFVESNTSISFARGLEPESLSPVRAILAMHDETVAALAAE